MLVAELQIGHTQGRSFLVRLAFIAINICGMFVRLRPAR